MRASDGYTIEDARRAASSGNRAVFSDGEHGAARLAIREHERAEALARKVDHLERRVSHALSEHASAIQAANTEHERAEALAQRVAELEALHQWTPHGGGPQPVNGPVWVRLRDGHVDGPSEAHTYDWDHHGILVEDGDWDIIAYRTTDPAINTSPTAGEE